MDTQFRETLTLVPLNIHPPDTSMGAIGRMQHITLSFFATRWTVLGADSIYYTVFLLKVSILNLIMRQLSDNCRIQIIEQDNWLVFLQTINFKKLKQKKSISPQARQKEKEKRCFSFQRTKEVHVTIVCYYHISLVLWNHKHLSFSQMSLMADIDLFAEDRPVVCSVVYILQLSDYFLTIKFR